MLSHAELYWAALTGAPRLIVHPDDAVQCRPDCDTLLRSAVKLVERVNEASCGLWISEFVPLKKRIFRAKEYAVILRVDSSADFLKKLGIKSKEDKEDGRAIVRLGLTCDICMKEFARYCDRRWNQLVLFGIKTEG